VSLGAAAESEPYVLDMRNGLGQQLADVIVVQLVDDLPSGPLAHDEAEVPQHAQLVRDRRRLHAHGSRQLVDRGGAAVEAGEDAQAARRASAWMLSAAARA
jgi:hypothetical protein